MTVKTQNLARILLIIIIPVLAGLLTYAFISTYLLTPADKNNRNKQIVVLKPEMGFRGFAMELQDRGLLKHWRSLELLARLNKSDTKIQAGEYEISPAMTPKEILAKLISGEIYKRLIIVTEGTSIWDLGKPLEEAGITNASSFNALLTDIRLIAKLGIFSDSFEGYLFPKTYNFTRNTDPTAVINKMVEEGNKAWTAQRLKRAQELNLSKHEVLTLASIIEKESGKHAELPLISSVFHNRLKSNMRLQSDPTVIYGIPNFKGPLTKTHLNTPSSYNTYIILGLPPGPICNPGLKAIDAALNPADSDYYYFVADGKGGHKFSKNLDDHNKAVQDYRKSRKAKKDKKLK